MLWAALSAISGFLLFTLLLTPVAYGEAGGMCPAPKPSSLAAQATAACCGPNRKGIIRADALELLRAVNPAEEAAVQGIAKILTGKVKPVFLTEELDLLQAQGIAQRKMRKVVRSVSDIYDIANYNENTRSYRVWAESYCQTSTTQQDFPFPTIAYPRSANHNAAKVYPYVREGQTYESAKEWCEVWRTKVMWVEEPTWVISLNADTNLYVAYGPGLGNPQGSWEPQVIARRHSNYNPDFFFASANWAADAGQLTTNAAVGEFLIGLLPFVGSGIQLVDGIQNGSTFDTVLGTVGVIGDFGGIAGLVADACKLPKLRTVLSTSGCAANFMGNGVTVVLVAKNFWAGEGSGLQAGIGTLSVAQMLAAIVLTRKYKSIDASAVQSTPSAKKLEVENVRCPDSQTGARPPLACNSGTCTGSALKPFSGAFPDGIDDPTDLINRLKDKIEVHPGIEAEGAELDRLKNNFIEALFGGRSGKLNSYEAEVLDHIARSDTKIMLNDRQMNNGGSEKAIHLDPFSEYPDFVPENMRRSPYQMLIHEGAHHYLHFELYPKGGCLPKNFVKAWVHGPRTLLDEFLADAHVFNGDLAKALATVRAHYGPLYDAFVARFPNFESLTPQQKMNALTKIVDAIDPQLSIDQLDPAQINAILAAVKAGG